MAQPQKHPTPAQQLARLLADRKRRGLTWDDAWIEIYHEIRWPAGSDYTQWQTAISATLPEWRAAYEDRESPIARTLRLVQDPDERVPIPVPVVA